MLNFNENDTKVRIMHSAIELFKDKGYQNVTISDICKNCKVTRNAFYYHFKEKGELLDIYFLDFLNIESVITEDSLIPIMNFSSYIEQFFAFFNLYLEQALQAGPELMGLFYQRNMDKTLSLLVPEEAPLWKLYISIINNSQEAGEILNPKPVVELVRAYLYMANGCIVVWCTQKGNFDLIAAHREAFNAIFQVPDPVIVSKQ